MKNLNFSVIAPYMTLLPAAIKMVLTIGLCAFQLASLLAVVVGNLRSCPHWKPLEVLLAFYVEFFRGTPLMVQLFIVYYGLPSFGVKLPPVPAAILTMGLNSGAYLAENMRAAILSVDRGQYEASALLGYTPFQCTFHIVLPQALRIALPSFMNGFSTMIKETSIASLLPIIELMKLGNQIYAKTYHPFEIFITIAVVYFLMTYFVTILSRWAERRLAIWAN